MIAAKITDDENSNNSKQSLYFGFVEPAPRAISITIFLTLRSYLSIDCRDSIFSLQPSRSPVSRGVDRTVSGAWRLPYGRPYGSGAQESEIQTT
jgi:hypothetical protein